MEPNLLVTIEPSHEGLAKQEIDSLMKGLKKKPKYLKSEVSGLLKLRIPNPRDVVKKIIKACKKDPSKFRKTFHWIPVDKWVKSDVKAMQKYIKSLAKKIKKNEAWKMNIEKRNYDKMHTTELILKLTEVVDRPNVDLEKPKKIISVEIIGKKAGISLLNADEILDVHKVTGK